MLQDKIKVLFKRRRDNKLRYSANKIFISKAEIKHTNRNILIILHLYNKQKRFIQWYIRKAITLIKFKTRVVQEIITEFGIDFVEDKIIFIPNHKNRLLHLLKNSFFPFKK